MPEGSKAPLLEEIDGTTLLENQQFEHDHPDQFQSAEKQAFEQRMLEMESLLRAVVHDNNNLRARLEGLVIQNEVNAPNAADEVIVSPPHHISVTVQKNGKPPKPPARQMPAVHSDEGSSSMRSVTFRRRENSRSRPNDAPHHSEVGAQSQRSSVFRRLGATSRQVEEPLRSSSALRALGNKVQNQPLHGAPKTNPQLQEVDEMLARLEKIRSELAAENTTSSGSPFSVEIQKEVLPMNVRQPHLEHYEGTSDPEDHMAYFMNTLQLHNFSDAIMCKLFASSLKGVARSWFSQLPVGSIKTFSQLASHF